jgi:hypothetical protein
LRRAASCAVVLAIIAIATILTVKGARNSPQPVSRPTNASGLPRHPMTGGAPSRALTEHFSVFRARPRAGDDITPRARGGLATSFFVDQAHLAAKLAPLRGPGHATDADFFIAGGPGDTVCLLALPPGADGPGGQCVPAQLAAAGRSVITQERASEDGRSEVDVYGIVPDDIDRVEVALADGAIAVLPVSKNSYSATLPMPPRTVSYVSPGGAVTIKASS